MKKLATLAALMAITFSAKLRIFIFMLARA